MTLSHSGETFTHLMSLYYTERRLNHDLMYTMDHTFSNRSQKFICACEKSSTHAHGTEIRGGKFKYLKLRKDSQGNGQFATELQGSIWISDGNPRRGTFHQTQVTMGDTPCSVKGVFVSARQTLRSNTKIRFEKSSIHSHCQVQYHRDTRYSVC